MLTATDIITYYLNNKPFEISDEIKYSEMLNSVAQFTMLEFSENEPIITEKAVMSPTSPTNDYVLLDLYSDIDENFMSFIILEEKNKIDSITNKILSSYIGAPEELSAIRQAVNSGSLVSFLAIRDALYSMEEWFHLNISKIIFDKSKIKVLPDIEYYCLYKRYRELDEIVPSDLNAFKNLFFINLLINSYRSEIYTSEAAIRSVAISSLSVSFNVASTKDLIVELGKEKDKIMSELAMVYDEDMVGII